MQLPTGGRTPHDFWNTGTVHLSTITNGRISYNNNITIQWLWVLQRSSLLTPPCDVQARFFLQDSMAPPLDGSASNKATAQAFHADCQRTACMYTAQAVSKTLCLRQKQKDAVPQKSLVGLHSAPTALQAAERVCGTGRSCLGLHMRSSTCTTLLIRLNGRPPSRYTGSHQHHFLIIHKTLGRPSRCIAWSVHHAMPAGTATCLFIIAAAAAVPAAAIPQQLRSQMHPQQHASGSSCSMALQC